MEILSNNARRLVARSRVERKASSKRRRVMLLVAACAGVCVLWGGLGGLWGWRGEAKSLPAQAAQTVKGRIAFVSGRDGNLEIYSMNPDGSDQTRLTADGADDVEPSWSPDGARIAFMSRRDGSRDIYVMNADGSNQTRLTTRLGFDVSSNMQPAWSPDGSRIAFVKDPNTRGTQPGIYVMNADGSNQTRLTDHASLNDMPAWSPDGSKIVFRSNRRGSRSDIFVMNADGSAQTHIPTGDLNIVENPAWSPDGSSIAFNGSNIYSVGGLHVMSADGSNLRRLGGTSTLDAQPAWSPDSKQIAFLAYGGIHADIYVMNIDGTGARVKVAGHDAYDGLPDWQRLASDTGGHIGFLSDRDGNSEIYTMNPDGSGQENISRSVAGERAFAWSPDGSRIAFIKSKEGSTQMDDNLYVMNADGSNQVKLTDDDFQHIHLTTLSWSPDGTTIAYVAGSDLVHDLYLINADGTNRRRFSQLNGPYLDLVWSPDGKRLAFSVGLGFNLSNIYVVNADGTGQTAVTSDDESIHYSRSPAWSPDSARLAFESNRDGNDEIYVVALTANAPGVFPARLTNNPARDIDPSWSPDGSSIAFASDRDGNFQNFSESNFEIYTMDASDGGHQQRLTTNTFADTRPQWQPAGASPTPAPDTLQFSLSAYRRFEDPAVVGFPVEVTVTRLGARSAAARVDFATSDGTASGRTDYTAMSGTLDFAPGEASKSFIVPVTYDSFEEGNETVNLTLSNASGAAVLGSQNAATLTISDFQSGEPLANTIDIAENFVRQHYHDFLNREPDPQGLQFWTSQITACAGDAACVQRKRIDVSGAFFLSVEFQQTGYLVHRLQMLSFKEFPRYADFIRDTQSIGRGVVVGQGDWEVRLTANRRIFTDEWVARPAFRAVFDSKTNAEYVDALIVNSGIFFASGDFRNGLVADLNSGAKTRAEVLRQIAELGAYREKEFNRAFVLMQYFGYLRRNPDDAPDADFSGYNFWLNKLDEHGGDFRRAEMVKAFITSPEYRHRFGQ